MTNQRDQKQNTQQNFGQQGEPGENQKQPGQQDQGQQQKKAPGRGTDEEE